MESLAVTLLGTMQVSCGGQVISTFESVQVRALLAYLVVEAEKRHSRSLLATLLWPEMPEEVSRGNLRQALANLRRVLDHCMVESPLIVTREAVQWNQASSYWLDVSAFSALLDAVALHPHRNAGSCSSCARQLTQATELYSGDFLAHFYLPDSEPFEEWALLKREHLQRRALGALERLAEYHARRGAYEEARKYRLRQVELAPWYEDAHYDLMRLHLVLGERSAALAQYHSCRRLMLSELGVEPAEATQALYEEIRGWRVDGGDQSPLARPGSQISRSNLPSAPNRFIGRGDSLARLINLLEDPSRRLVTLVGAPGIGKTRLALEAAAQHAYSFADGAHFVSLAPVERADLVTSTLARTLGVQETASGQLEDHLVSYLRGRELLLVLDNFEHVISASTVVRELLDGAPHLQVMATSRQPLGLYGEQLFAVPPLAIPDTESRQGTDHLPDYEAIQLFVERARAVECPGSRQHLCSSRGPATRN
jgi:DNA-binding SARP family transcriptional activator